jgi:hypothetical protein
MRRLAVGLVILIRHLGGCCNSLPTDLHRHGDSARRCAAQSHLVFRTSEAETNLVSFQETQATLIRSLPVLNAPTTTNASLSRRGEATARLNR